MGVFLFLFLNASNFIFLNTSNILFICLMAQSVPVVKSNYDLITVTYK